MTHEQYSLVDSGEEAEKNGRVEHGPVSHPECQVSSTSLCPRCEALDLKVPKGDSPSFKVIAKLGDVGQLLSSSECELCQLLSRVRPTTLNCDSGGSLDCSLV